MRSIAIYNAKGGAGKSLLSSCLGVTATSGLWHQTRLRTLIVDLDDQGNIRFDLGYEGDGGEELTTALIEGRPLDPLRDVRPGLDVAAGGSHLEDLTTELVHMFESHPDAARSLFDTMLEPISGDYDLIIFDTAGNLGKMTWPMLYFVDAIVSPLVPDPAAHAALGRVRANIAAIGNGAAPEFLMAVLVNDHLLSSFGREFREQLTAEMETTGDRFPLSATSIRWSQASAARAKKLGITPIELAGLAQQGMVPEQIKSIPAATLGLGRDLTRACQEILDALFRDEPVGE